jgi:hypothetical protein
MSACEKPASLPDRVRIGLLADFAVEAAFLAVDVTVLAVLATVEAAVDAFVAVARLTAALDTPEATLEYADAASATVLAFTSFLYFVAP